MRLKLTITLTVLLLLIAGISTVATHQSSGGEVMVKTSGQLTITSKMLAASEKKIIHLDPTTTTTTTLPHKSLQREVPRVTKRQIATVLPARGTVSPSASSAGWCYALPDNYYAHYIVDHEAGCTPSSAYQYNKAGSGACGIPQFLPCRDYGNPWAQTRDMIAYVMGKYGSWAAAYNHKVNTGWY